MHKYLFALLFLAFAALQGCKWPAWVGTYYSEGCTMLESIEFHPDETADIKYFSAPFSVNREVKITGNTYTVDNYVFEFRDSAMYEVSGMEIGCVLKKKAKE